MLTRPILVALIGTALASGAISALVTWSLMTELAEQKAGSPGARPAGGETTLRVDTAPLASIPFRPELPAQRHPVHAAPEQGTEPPEEANGDETWPDVPIDSEEARFRRLLSHQERYMNSWAEGTQHRQLVHEAHAAAACSVAAVLRAQGRADFGTEEERQFGFSSRPEYQGQQVFFCDSARYRVDRGEFPVYDVTRKHLFHDQVRNGPEPPLPPDFHTQMEALIARGIESSIVLLDH